MRKVFYATICVFALAGCGHKDGNLRANAKGYIQAMADYRIEDAYQYATPETQKATLDYFSNTVMPLVDSSYIEKNTPATVWIDSVVFLSDTDATVFYHKSTPIQPMQKMSLDMRLRGGNWLAHQVIERAPYIGGQFQVIDTAALAREEDGAVRQGHSYPKRVINL